MFCYILLGIDARQLEVERCMKMREPGALRSDMEEIERIKAGSSVMDDDDIPLSIIALHAGQETDEALKEAR